MLVKDSTVLVRISEHNWVYPADGIGKPFGQLRGVAEEGYYAVKLSPENASPPRLVTADGQFSPGNEWGGKFDKYGDALAAAKVSADEAARAASEPKPAKAGEPEQFADEERGAAGEIVRRARRGRPPKHVLMGKETEAVEAEE